MKSTDTILGAFGVLGIVLLGVVVASSMETNNREINPDLVDGSTETLLYEEENTADKDLMVNETISDEIVLGDSNNNFDVTKWQDYGITNQELLALIDSEDNSISFNNVDSSILTELETMIGSNLRTEQAKFKQQNSDEIVLGVNESSDDKMAVMLEDDSEIKLEFIPVNDIDLNVADSDTEFTDDVNDDEIEPDELIVLEDSQEVSDHSPSRFSAFFNNLFGNDAKDKEVNDLDKVGQNVGGTLEGAEKDQSAVVQGQYVVQTGDSVWEILTENGYSNGAAANIINDMRMNSNAADSFGITSGSVDLIYPGQVLNFSGF